MGKKGAKKPGHAMEKEGNREVRHVTESQEEQGQEKQQHGNREVRHVTEAAELCEKNGKVECNTLFRFDYCKGRLVKWNKSSKVFEKARQGFGFERKGFEKEIERRAWFLKEMEGKGIAMKEFFEKVNSF